MFKKKPIYYKKLANSLTFLLKVVSKDNNKFPNKLSKYGRVKKTV